MADSAEFCSGDPALDFLNTRGGSRHDPSDELASPEAFLAWLERAGLRAPSAVRRFAATPPDARVLLNEARALREAIRAAVRSLRLGRPQSERCLFALNRVLAFAGRRPQLETGAAGLEMVEQNAAGSVLALLAPLAEAAARLLVDGDPVRIRQCRASDCDRWFLDSSKNGRRKWCSMSGCGNRAKAAAHYRRHQSA